MTRKTQIRRWYPDTDLLLENRYDNARRGYLGPAPYLSETAWQRGWQLSSHCENICCKRYRYFEAPGPQAAGKAFTSTKPAVTKWRSFLFAPMASNAAARLNERQDY